jgi:uncharacterized protein DUF3455
MTVFTTFARLARLTAPLAAGGFFMAAAGGARTESGSLEVPAGLNPDQLSVFRVVPAVGAQVYACASSPAGTAGWVPKGPDAQLFDSQNKPVGKHFAGPTWEGLDGGKVVGEVKASMPAPVERAIPWLLLRIKSRDGSGAFTQAQAIVRMRTTGGTAPGGGCDEAHAGQEVRVPYTAIYVFLK